MLEWLKQQVYWLIRTASDAYNWIISFIHNPYPTIRSVIDWAITQACNFTNAVKTEIANWTYGLITNLWNWVNWLSNLYNSEIAPRLNALWSYVQNVANSVWQQIKPIFEQAIANLWNWITWLDNLIKTVRNELYKLYGTVQGWVRDNINKLIADVAWLKNNIGKIDLTQIYKDIGQLLRWVYDFDILFYKKLGDMLLERLEELLAEAME